MKLPTTPASRNSKFVANASATPKPQGRKTLPFALGITHKSRNLRCLRRLRREKPVDLVISDLTAINSMTDADAETLMSSLHGLVKRSGPILLAANALVGAALVAASPHYKYSLIFEVSPARSSDPSVGPVQNHLEYHVFYDEAPPYKRLKTRGHSLKVVSAKTKEKTALSPDPITNKTNAHGDYSSTSRNPRSVLRIHGKSLSGDPSAARRTEYLLRSFSRRNDIFMDVMKTSSVARRACEKFHLHYLEFKGPNPSPVHFGN